MEALIQHGGSPGEDAPAPRFPSLTYLERYRNEGTRTYSEHAGYSEAREAFRPTAMTRAFDLPATELSRTAVNVYTARPTPELTARYLPEGRALMCIHPQVLTELPREPYVRRTRALGRGLAPIRVQATSSTRTLIVEGGNPEHALKVHFPFRVSRYGRKMRDEVVEQAIRVSAELELAAPRFGLDFAFLREVLGVTHRNLDPTSSRGEHWGYLVREATPFPARSGATLLVPGFALYGRDRFDPGAPPLLHELADAPARASWILHGVLLPIIRHWITAFRTLGLILEPHGQNVLLEVGADGRVHRIVHRDLSVGIDMRRRRDAGLGEGALNGYNRMTSGDFASIAYDRFMGGHFFDRLVAQLQADDPGLARSDLVDPCREEFARAFPEHREYLPPSVHYFSEQRDRFGKPLFQDTGRRPDWRP